MDKVNYVIYLLFKRIHNKRLSQDIKTLACNPLILLLFVTQLHNISDNGLCQLLSFNCCFLTIASNFFTASFASS